MYLKRIVQVGVMSAAFVVGSGSAAFADPTCYYCCEEGSDCAQEAGGGGNLDPDPDAVTPSTRFNIVDFSQTQTITGNTTATGGAQAQSGNVIHQLLDSVLP